MKTVVVGLGELVRKSTAAMDSGEIYCEFVIMELGGMRVMFLPRALENMMHIIGGVFYRNYGGWNVALECHKNGVYAERLSFAPSHQVGFSGVGAMEHKKSIERGLANDRDYSCHE